MEAWHNWCEKAKAWQLPPPWKFDVWDLRPGHEDRGYGKTRAAAEYVAARMRLEPGLLVALVGRYGSSAAQVMLPALTQALAENYALSSRVGVLRTVGGSCALAYSSEDPYRMSGLSFGLVWADECGDDALEQLPMILPPVVLS